MNRCQYRGSRSRGDNAVGQPDVQPWRRGAEGCRLRLPPLRIKHVSFAHDAVNLVSDRRVRRSTTFDRLLHLAACTRPHTWCRRLCTERVGEGRVPLPRRFYVRILPSLFLVLRICLISARPWSEPWDEHLLYRGGLVKLAKAGEHVALQDGGDKSSISLRFSVPPILAVNLAHRAARCNQMLKYGV